VRKHGRIITAFMYLSEGQFNHTFSRREPNKSSFEWIIEVETENNFRISYQESK
jgi:hypothetical protein